jgi:SAM-dependent methyltransferase
MQVSQFKDKLPNSSARSLKQMFLFVRGIFYYGRKYHCNICNRNFRKMLKGGFNLKVISEKQIIGAGIRNHICPFCQSTDRDRLVQLYLDTTKILNSNSHKLLHIAPEPSLYSQLIKRKNINYIPAVKYHEGIYYPKNITLVDITDMCFNNEEFDMIICNHVLEHIDNDIVALSEIHRVLRKGGIAILQVPYSNLLNKTYENVEMTTVAQREEHFGQFDHVRLYGTDYQSKLESAGFMVQQFDPKSVIKNVEIEKLALFANENLFVAFKPM